MTFVFKTDIIRLLIRGLAIKKSFKWDKTVSGLIPLFVFTRGKACRALPYFLLSEVICMNVKTKSLAANILPALGGLFVTYLYNVVDGIFVGQGVDSAALVRST